MLRFGQAWLLDIARVLQDSNAFMKHGKNKWFFVVNSIINHLNSISTLSQPIDILVYERNGRPTWMGYGSDGAWEKLPVRSVTFSVGGREISSQLFQLFLSHTSASVKSYQLVKVVSGGRAPGKSSGLASPQLWVIERFHCFGAVRLEKVQFLYATAFGTCIWSYFQWGYFVVYITCICKHAVPWCFPSKIIQFYMPHGRCTNRISIWGDDMGICHFPCCAQCFGHF